MSYLVNLVSLALLLVVYVSVAASHSCDCKDDKGNHHMMQCDEEKYCCGEKKDDWHCCGEDEKFGHHKRALVIGLGVGGLLIVVASCIVCVCCYKYKKRNTTRNAKVLPSSTTTPVVAVVSSTGYSKEQEALGLGQSETKGYPPPSYPAQIYFQAPPSYSQIDLRAAEPTAPTTPCPAYDTPTVP